MAKQWTKLDPSRTRTERGRFMQEVKRRFRKLADSINTFLVKEDAFGLEPRVPGVFNSEERIFVEMGDGTATMRDTLYGEERILQLMHLHNVQPRRYQFLTNPQKIRQFQQWLQQQIDRDLLTVVGGVTGKPWTSLYVESAWRKGMMRAYTEIRKGDTARIAQPEWYRGSKEEWWKSAFSQPEMLSKVELLATRAFEGMKGITQTISTQLSRILADGLVNGYGPQKIARRMTDSIKSITRTRALVIARTETIYAHAEGQLDGYKMLGISEVSAEVEWLTAEDMLVCGQCSGMEGKTFTVQEAHGMIPLHPNCRCAWKPVVSSKRRR